MKNKFSEQDFNPDLYSRLGLPPSASDDEIKKSFRSLAQKNHPDKFPGDKEKEVRFVAVNRAYQVLSDSSARRLYDSALERVKGRDPAYGKERSDNSQKRDSAGEHWSKADRDAEDIIRRAYKRYKEEGSPFSSTDFEHSGFYKHYEYTQEEVEQYKKASARFASGLAQKGDLSTIFNFQDRRIWVKAPSPSASSQPSDHSLPYNHT